MLLTRPSKAANRKTNLLEESLKLCLHEMPQLSCAVERHYFKRKCTTGEIAQMVKFQIPAGYVIYIKIVQNNLAFPSQISQMQMVELISKIEVVSFDCAA